MNREIKFRAWVIWMSQMFYHEEINYGHVLDYKEPHDDIELMQFTGLKDKNGREIYEGDIINGGGLGSVVVKYGWYDNGLDYEDHDSGLGFYFEDRLGRIYGGFGWSCLFKDTAVIGNIYENPELLNQKI